MSPTFGSLFTGVGGFDLGLERAGWACAFQCEIDPFCRRVLARHWPRVERFTDVSACFTTPGIWYLGDDGRSGIDLLCGGFPCQDLSVAGKRAGLAGERSGLFWEFVRVAKELRPPLLLLENVPGLLSSDGGRDVGVVLDALHEAGYLTEIEECDSQNFGVAQRRRRLFFIGADAISGLQTPTHTSSAMLAAVVAQSLLDAWELLAEPSGIASTDSENPEPSPASTGLRRRMLSYAASPEPSAWPNLAHILAARRMASEFTPASWACPFSRHGDGLTATASSGSEASSGMSTEKSWQQFWGDLWRQPSASTISTWSSTTTPEKICMCAAATVHISQLIEAWTGSCPHCWNAGSLTLTALLACIDSLGRLTDDLFVEAAWRDRARLLLLEAEAAAVRILGNCGASSADSILFEPEGRAGHPAASREAEACIAANLTAGSHGAGVSAPGRRKEDDVNLVTHALTLAKSGLRFDPSAEDYVCGTLNSGGNSGGFRTEPGEHLIIPSLKAEGADASEDGTGRGVPMVAATLNPGHEAKHSYPDDGGAMNLVATSSVRRLTPTETERLQGFPDGFTCLCGVEPYSTMTCRCPDSARYRAMGNAVTVSVIEWIGQRLLAVHLSQIARAAECSS